MMEYRKLAPKRFSSRQIDEDAKYWKAFKTQVQAKEFAPVTSIDFNPVEPFDFAVSSSARVQIYSSKTNSLKKTISRFKEFAYSATYRHDGKLLGAGDGSGLVQIFDINSRSVLRQFNGHSQAVRAVRFLPNNTHVVSASDDCSVRVWDIPSQSVVCTWEQEHTDHVRSLAVSHDNANLIISGSYDHTVKVWDIRTRQAVLTLKHGSPNGSSYPVEALLVFPGDSVILSAGGNQLRTWDILGGTGGRLLNVASNHQKTITSMCFGTDYSRVLTASLDQQVKVYDVTDYHVVHSFKCPSPLLSIAVSPNDSHIVTGTVSGLLSVRERHILAEDQRTMKRFRHRSVVPVKTSSNFSFFLKGSQRVSTNTELFVKEDRKLRISQYEHLLRRFQYGEALDAAVKKGRPAIVFAVLEELIYRGDGIRIALSSRDDSSLEPILEFVIRYIQHPYYSDTVAATLDMIIEIYSTVAHLSPVIMNLLARINSKLRFESSQQVQFQELLGIMDMVMNYNKSSTARATNE